MAHLFCKECILTSILCQRQEIRKAELDLLQESSKAALEAKEMDIQFENKKISAFEASQIIGEDFSSTIQYSTLEPNAKRKTMGRLPKMVTGKVKKSIVCPATRSGEKEHHVSVKELVVVSAGDLFNCRSCLENFSNGVGFSVYKNCGHAVCQKCIKNVNSLGICPSCDVKTEAIKVVCDGTGYASSKEAPEVIVASKYRPAFI